MILLLNLVVLFVGLILGLGLLAATSLFIPSLFSNLGLHGTLLATFSVFSLLPSWFFQRNKSALIVRSSALGILSRVFFVSVLLFSLVELAFGIYGAPNPEWMTWGDKVVIANGQRTFEGWALILRGIFEGGLAGLIIGGAVIAASKIMDRILAKDKLA